MVITGVVGEIEIRKGKCFSEEGENKALLIIAHPHPLYQGTMNNKVVTTIERAAAQAQVATLCFNFRGVGKTQGEYDQGQGEVEDVLQIIAWAKGLGFSEFLLAGFSFGAYVMMQVQQRTAIKQLMTVAPPVGLYDFSTLTQAADTEQWSMVVAGQDEVVSVAEILDWYRALEQKPDLLVREQASHFFHGQLIWLRQQVQFWLTQ